MADSDTRRRLRVRRYPLLPSFPFFGARSIPPLLARTPCQYLLACFTHPTKNLRLSSGHCSPPLSYRASANTALQEQDATQHCRNSLFSHPRTRQQRSSALDARDPGEPTTAQTRQRSPRAPVAVPGRPGAQGCRRAARAAAGPQSSGGGHDDDADARGRVRAGRPESAEPVTARIDRREHTRGLQRAPQPLERQAHRAAGVARAAGRHGAINKGALRAVRRRRAPRARLRPRDEARGRGQ